MHRREREPHDDFEPGVNSEIPPDAVFQHSHSIVVPKAPRTISDSSPVSDPEESTFASSLVAALTELGTQHAFGIFGGGIAPFSRAVEQSPIRLLHFRHEGGAAFAAIESSLQSGRLTVVLATTGPGLTNLYTGMLAARAEGAKVLFVTGGTAAAQRGRMAFQETSASVGAMAPLFSTGSLFHYAATIESTSELEAVVSRLRTGVARPGGFVAHLGLPMSTQTGRVSSLPSSRVSAGPPPVCHAQTIQACVDLLMSEPFVIWTGFGAAWFSKASIPPRRRGNHERTHEPRTSLDRPAGDRDISGSSERSGGRARTPAARARLRCGGRSGAPLRGQRSSAALVDR
jgi:hypothetical protein